MDSMRSLGRSLPSRANNEEPSEQLLQAFRSAALSVTTLYKTAASEQNSQRDAGYQDALAELVAFLDEESLGEGSEDGRRIRRWVAEKLGNEHSSVRERSTESRRANSKENDAESGLRARSSTPQGLDQDSADERRLSPSPSRTSADKSPPVRNGNSTIFDNQSMDPQTSFTFESSTRYPQQDGRNIVGESRRAGSRDRHTSEETQMHIRDDAPSLRLELVPSRHGRNKRLHPGQMNARLPGSTYKGPSWHAHKRKLPFEEFFDVKDAGQMGVLPKRGRHS